MTLSQYVACARCRQFTPLPPGLSLADGAAFAEAWLRLGCPHDGVPTPSEPE